MLAREVGADQIAPGRAFHHDIIFIVFIITANYFHNRTRPTITIIPIQGGAPTAPRRAPVQKEQLATTSPGNVCLVRLAPGERDASRNAGGKIFLSIAQS